ncbi:trimethylguanosine synthase-like isoform X1 [Zingiber officinale]|uniref:trimethylguanosine synthase-like isoform X1 n=1 Tax=Zingiber officinale TaxID=94328 RepID=UPI001C4CAA53|nr:trimethylguanosine synthase-like isoform X1 [Zingiber officinale]
MADPKKRKRRSQPKKGKLPQSHVILTPSIVSYWHQRYSLFSRFDDGVLMDEEGWYSVTPEAIAASHAERASAYVHCGRSLVLDGFAGVGGNAIQFASRGCHVVSVDIDPRKVEFAVNNAKIYGVEDRIDFVIGDFFHLAPFLKGDVLFLSPPWGGPSYRHLDNYTLDFLKPKDGYSIFQQAQQITPNIIMFLPRNVDVNQVEELSWLSSPPLNFELEENRVQSKVKAITAYFGDIASR